MLGALNSEEALTPLGQHLSKMPVDIRLAKTLIYASMLRRAPLQHTPRAHLCSWCQTL